MQLYDAHNHLQDSRLAPQLNDIGKIMEREGIVRCVVNGSSTEDWPLVVEVTKRIPGALIPSFGVHPWYVKECAGDWFEEWLRFLDSCGGGAVGAGEVGLDRWVEGYDLPLQEEIFRRQLQVAAERNLPTSIHCLRAWGRLFDLLRLENRPNRGFLLHSYGGPKEMIEPLARLGAYFSISGHFAHERKARQRENFRSVPPERLLIETDAPDMVPPPSRVRYPSVDEEGRPFNHPGNLVAVYEMVADLLGRSVGDLAPQVEENFLRLFG